MNTTLLEILIGIGSLLISFVAWLTLKVIALETQAAVLKERLDNKVEYLVELVEAVKEKIEKIEDNK